MKKEKEFKIDLVGSLKYLYKLSKEISRRKKMLYSFCFAFVNGLIYFLISENTTILFCFMVASSILLANILDALYCWKIKTFPKK